jgi:hypothetical protein
MFEVQWFIPQSAFRVIPHSAFPNDSAFRIPHSTLEKFRIPAGPDGPLSEPEAGPGAAFRNRKHLDPG